MENIILQIVSESVKEFIKYFEGQGIGALSHMAEEFKQISDEMAKKVLLAFIASADGAINEAKAERKADGIKVHERNVPRTLYTALGSLTYERTYFDTAGGRSYLLDSILDVPPYERIDSGVSAQLVNAAAHNSYKRSADIATGGQISRQSVKNKAMSTGEVLYEPARVRRTPEALHIFADEDHVNLQNGKNTILPLITVSAGKRGICKGRNELIDPFHVHGYGITPEEHWEYVYALCAEKYDISRVRKVYIYADGAPWIKKCFDVFPGAVYILDKFHFKKRMRALFAGALRSPFSLPARTAIMRNDRQSFDRAIQKMFDAIEEKLPESGEKSRMIKSVKEHSAYILAHWDAIQNSGLPESVGSCTEALVSHALSERFSRNPMGWSEEGLSKMAMIRIFALNGGKVGPADTLAWKHSDKRHRVITKLEKYDAIIKVQQEKIFKDVKGWRWFEVDSLISGKTTGTRVALDALARTRNIG